MLEDIGSFFKALIEKFKNPKRRPSPFVIIIFALIIVIPTLFAVYYAYFYEDTSFLAANKVKVELYGSEDKLLASEEVAEANISENDIVNIFYNINIYKEGIETPSDLVKSNFKFAVTHKNQSEEYSCYFTTAHDTSYIEDKKGNFYSVSERYYNYFLNSEFSESVYPFSTPPQLTTGNGEAVTPLSVDWSYKRQDKVICQSTNMTVSLDMKTYKIGGAINLSFDKAPDSSSIKLYDGEGNEIYKGTLDEVPYVIIKTGSQINAKLSAVWEEDDESDYFGEINYDFNIVLSDRASFSISRTEATAGEFVIISGINIDDVSRIVYSLSTDVEADADTPEGIALNSLLSFEPVFVLDGDYARAMIPFPADAPKGVYNLSVAFGVAEKSFSVNLSNKSYSNNVLNKEAAEVLSSIMESSLTAFEETLSGVISPENQSVIFRGAFASPANLGFARGYSFGNTVTAADSDTTSFRASGNEYIADTGGGKNVTALNIGVVVDTGYCSYLGNYVVVEHGLGLRTWYCCLSSTDVNEGDIVAKGDILGKCGSYGILSSSGVLILCSVYETLIDPSFILGKEITLSTE